MIQAAIAAAVFGGAIFLAPGSQASLWNADNTNNSKNNQTINKVVLANADDSGRATAAPASQEAAKAVTVKVAQGDYLAKIASDNGTTYQRLYDANPSVEHPDKIHPGQELRIPAAEEQLASRPQPVPPAPAPVAAPALTAPAVPQTQAYSAPAPRPAAAASGAVSAPAVADGSVWDRLALCEATGNWAINNGNGYYGGLQFSLSSWRAVGGSGYPHQASREEQIMRGQMLQSRQGWGAWPACTAKMGLR